MKKLLPLLIVACSLSFQAPSQNPDLFQTWYLHSISYENGDFIDVSGFNPPINPNLVIMPSFEFNGQGACNTFEGTFIFFEPKDLEVAAFSDTTASCGFLLDQFEDSYFDFFQVDAYMITFINDDGNDEQTLFMIGGPFTELTFRNVPVLSSPEFDIEAFSIYPNPCGDFLHFNWTGASIESSRIYAINGKQLLLEKGELNKLDVSSLDTGIYFVEITTSEGKTFQRFIKE